MEDAPAQALVNLATVRDNVTALRRHVGAASVMAVVKSDAYGHGLIPVATAALAAVIIYGALGVYYLFEHLPSPADEAEPGAGDGPVGS